MIVVRDEDHIAESRGEFEAIDWSSFGDYDSYWEDYGGDSDGYGSYGYYGY